MIKKQIQELIFLNRTISLLKLYFSTNYNLLLKIYFCFPQHRLLGVLKLLLLIVCHSLHEDQGEEGDGGHEVQHVDVSVKSRSHDPGRGGDPHEEEVLIEADESQIEQAPSDFCV